ncbi:MAG TPA: polysaccharide biosynthesis/export family protein [Blastocatellia bacterium]|nr:polysaccharide biosynthesis/export family protein [Blastocatellia bacterium]
MISKTEEAPGLSPRSRRITLAALLALVGLASLHAPFAESKARQNAGGKDRQPPASAPPGAGSPAGVLVASDDDYRLGASDVIEVQVEDAKELSGVFRIGSNGSFLMPYLGRIKAGQKTPEEVGRMIADGLRGRYLKDPVVRVAVTQYNSRSFFIQGAVRNPGVYQVEGRPSILKLITIAGGLAENHGSSAFILREQKPPAAREGGAEGVAQSGEASPEKEGDNYSLIQVNIGGLLKGRFNENVFIEAGDIVNIPTSDVFFVAGEVRAPGSFPLKEGTTLRQAISLAQGTTFEAAKDRGIIFRENSATGKREEVKVDVGAVMSGKKEDVGLLANDIIIIPNSRGKTIGGALLKAFGMATVNRGVPVR